MNCVIIGQLTSLAALTVDYDDPQRPYVEEAMVRLCRCLKHEFTPYLATVLPPILETAQKSDIIVTESMHNARVSLYRTNLSIS